MSDQYSESRRNVLKGAAAIAAGGALLGGSSPAQSSALNDGSGNVHDGELGPNMAGTKFKAVVSRGFGRDSTQVLELTMLPINERQIVIKTEASQCCYTMCSRVLGTQAPPDPFRAAGRRDRQ